MSNQVQDHEGGVVIEFPKRDSQATPPPLPRLPRAIPTPGGHAGSAMFGAALTVRFDRQAA